MSDKKIYPKIVVSLTTLPGRYSIVEKTIDSLIKQSLKPDNIYLSIPKRSKRLGIEYPKVNPSLSSKCDIITPEDDYGPITKIYGGLFKEKNDDTIIITVDDDVHFDIEFIEKIVSKSLLFPDSAICATGALIGRGFYNISIYSSISGFKYTNFLSGFAVPKYGRPVDVCYGVGGVLYKRSFFPKDEMELMSFASKTTELFHNDDVVLSGWLSKSGIRRLLFSDIPPVRMLENGTGDALSSGLTNMLKRMDKSIEQAKELGMFNNTEPIDPTDPLVSKIIILTIILITVIVILFIIFSPKL